MYNRAVRKIILRDTRCDKACTTHYLILIDIEEMSLRFDVLRRYVRNCHIFIHDVNCPAPRDRLIPLPRHLALEPADTRSRVAAYQGIDHHREYSRPREGKGVREEGIDNMYTISAQKVSFRCQADQVGCNSSITSHGQRKHAKLKHASITFLLECALTDCLLTRLHDSMQ